MKKQWSVASGQWSVKRKGPRRGVAMILVLVYLAILSVLMTNVVRNGLAQKRYLQRRENQAQAYWLAQAGIEQAAARLLADPKGYKGETLELIPGSEVRTFVERRQELPNVRDVIASLLGEPERDRPYVFQITSEVSDSKGELSTISFSASRSYRLKQEKGKRVLVAVP